MLVQLPFSYVNSNPQAGFMRPFSSRARYGRKEICIEKVLVAIPADLWYMFVLHKRPQALYK